MRSAIDSQNLSYHYDLVQALDRVSLTVKQGTLFGLIGPDGAGKTTFFRIIASLIMYHEGHVQVLGFNPNRDYHEIRQRIGYMPGRFSLYQDLTVEENLQFYASVFGVRLKDNLASIRSVYQQIEPFKRRRAGRLSGGMKQKLALSCALIHHPELLILDEPTTGVDAVSRIEFWDLLKELKESGMTIVVSTPYMEEARRCDQIALIQKGRILETSPPDQIASRLQGDLFRVQSDDRYDLLKTIKESDMPCKAYLNGQYLHVITESHNQRQLSDWLAGFGRQISSIEKIQPTVEDRFIQLLDQPHE